MRDQADVGLVDAHAEGDGRADDRRVAVEESVLHGMTVIAVHAGVVVLRSDSVLAQSFGRLLCALARLAVDDRGLAWHLL